MTQQPIRIPSDVDREDKILGNLTARQLVILIVTGFVLYAGWNLSRPWVPVPVFLAAAVPIAAIAVLLAVGTRDGLSLDRLLFAAIQQRRKPRLHVAAPEGEDTVPDWITRAATRSAAGAPPEMPDTTVSEAGVIDLGPDGVALVAVASTVNFALRSPGEQEALVAAMGRYLNSLTAPVQILIRAQRLDLSSQVADLRDTAADLPHPALQTAAFEHADFLEHLATTAELLRRQVLIVLREPFGPTQAVDGLGRSSLRSLLRSRRGPAVSDAVRRAAEQRLARRLGEAIELLAPAGVVVSPLTAEQAGAVLASVTDPDSLLPAGVAATADEIITGGGR